MVNLYLQREAKRELSRSKQLQKSAQSDLELLEAVLPEQPGCIQAEDGRKTSRITQQELKDTVPLQNVKKIFTLDLQEEQSGGYLARYTRNGRHLLLASERSHYATFDWQTGKLHCEGHLEEDEMIRDATWLHNETFFALAQKNYVYMYDHAGVEVHRLKKHQQVLHMDFLPFHFLLATASAEGFLRYQDVSMGTLVAEHSFKQAGKSGRHAIMGRCSTLVQNRQNAMIHLGHVNGIVSLWAPSMNVPIAQMKCHSGPVVSLAVDCEGKRMASAGADGRVKIWDLRTYQQLDEYRALRAINDLSISQRGLLAVGNGPHVTVWKDVFVQHQSSPYMTHLMPTMTVRSLEFCPFEDILGIGNDCGFDSILIPGSGEPNYDVLDANPFSTRKQRQESEVHALLEKLPPDTIGIAPSAIGQVTRDHQSEVIPARKLLEDLQQPRRPRTGKTTAFRRYLKKRANVVDESKLELAEEKAHLEIRHNFPERPDFEAGTALERFIVKSA